MRAALDWTERALGSTWLPPLVAGMLAYRSGISFFDMILVMILFANITVMIEQIHAKVMAA